VRVVAAVVASVALLVIFVPPAGATYVNFESAHVHPIDLTPGGARLLAVNTPDALLEVLHVNADGSLAYEKSIPVGLEPVTVRARTASEAWVANALSDTVSVVDLDQGTVTRTIAVGDEPTDVVFASGRAFVAVSQEDAVKAWSLADLAQAPVVVPLFGRVIRSLAVSNDGAKVFAVALLSGNQTTEIDANVIWGTANGGLNAPRLSALGLNTIACPNNVHPPYPPHPAGTARSLTLTDPPNGQQPPVGLIVKWDPATGTWRDDAGQDWTSCLPFRLPDHDLFVIDAANPSGATVTTVDHLGTSLFDVSVNPANGRLYVPHTEARNNVRFEHPLGVQGHMVDNRLAIINPAAGNAVTLVDLNRHINRASDPLTNLAERQASLSQPGMMAWNAAGTFAWMTAIGSRKVFRLNQGCLDGPGPDYGACVFGPTRATPDAVTVGEGPTGVAVSAGAASRVYVLSRFTNSIAIVDPTTLVKVGELFLHDASPSEVKVGRHHLYDGIDSSGHGDAACSSCHLFGDRDGLAWDLGNPQGTFTPYGTPGDNVRFFPVDDPAVSAAHAGFDPEKGPMTTQTLRGMLEPLHWRGDRPTMINFNKAFVGLMGTADIGPINGEPAGISATAMSEFRRFALDIVFPPNPYRNVDDTVPNAVVAIAGLPNAGNPEIGRQRFFGLAGSATDGNVFCVTCHTAPFGANGGKLGGLEAGDPAQAKAALFNGNLDLSPHSDLKIPHLRNLYQKFGPRFGAPPVEPASDQKSGFGLTHDGAIPDLNTFLSAGVFTLTADDVKNISAFTMMFPTGTPPAVGRNLTLPAGAPPTGTTQQEALLSALITLGNLADPQRHCELWVAARAANGKERTWYLNGCAPGGLWTGDLGGAEAQLTTAGLRTQAIGPLTFTCATLGSGVRLGADRDEDGVFNGSDCAPADATAWEAPGLVTGVLVDAASHVAWDALPSHDGQAVVYDVAGGLLSSLPSSGFDGAGCLSGALSSPAWLDPRANPPVGNGTYYLVRARKACGTGSFGAASKVPDALVCAP
jgi:YVTN family beta-propeller protein